MKEPKILIDKLPDRCFDCPCFRYDIDLCCYLDDGSKNYAKDNGLEPEECSCPLQTIKQHDKVLLDNFAEKLMLHLTGRIINCNETDKIYITSLADINKALNDIKNEFTKE